MAFCTGVTGAGLPGAEGACWGSGLPSPVRGRPPGVAPSSAERRTRRTRGRRCTGWTGESARTATGSAAADTSPGAGTAAAGIPGPAGGTGPGTSVVRTPGEASGAEDEPVRGLGPSGTSAWPALALRTAPTGNSRRWGTALGTADTKGERPAGARCTRGTGGAQSGDVTAREASACRTVGVVGALGVWGPVAAVGWALDGRGCGCGCGGVGRASGPWPSRSGRAPGAGGVRVPVSGATPSAVAGRGAVGVALRCTGWGWAGAGPLVALGAWREGCGALVPGLTAAVVGPLGGCGGPPAGGVIGGAALLPGVRVAPGAGFVAALGARPGGGCGVLWPAWFLAGAVV